MLKTLGPMVLVALTNGTYATHYPIIGATEIADGVLTANAQQLITLPLQGSQTVIEYCHRVQQHRHNPVKN